MAPDTRWVSRCRSSAAPTSRCSRRTRRRSRRCPPCRAALPTPESSQLCRALGSAGRVRRTHSADVLCPDSRAQRHSPARHERPPPRPAQAWGADAAYDLHRGSLVAYSALRDPADGYVRVFLDAEPFLAPMLTCHFQARRGRPSAARPAQCPVPGSSAGTGTSRRARTATAHPRPAALMRPRSAASCCVVHAGHACELCGFAGETATLAHCCAAVTQRLVRAR
jgi:hypothetical protein